MIKEVDGTEITNPHRASCHCGAVVLELELPNGMESPVVVIARFVESTHIISDALLRRSMVSMWVAWRGLIP